MRRSIAPILASLVLTFGLVACGSDTENMYDEDLAATEATGPVESEPLATTEPLADDAWGEEWGSFADWDTDADQQLTDAEYERGFDTVWTRWDADASGDLNQTEASSQWWNWFDDDNDAVVTEDEWTAASTRFGDAGWSWGAWGDVDVDQDGQLGQTEFDEWFNENAWDSWDVDGDGVAGRDEAADTFWDLFDGNDDNMVDAGEWELSA